MMTPDALSAVIAADGQQAADVVRGAIGHIHDPDLSEAEAAKVITWLHCIEVRASEADDLRLLEEAVTAVLTWDASWDQREPQRMIRQWLAGLRGDQAAAVAHGLREYGEVGHFAELADHHSVDARIRRAIRQAAREPGSGGS